MSAINALALTLGSLLAVGVWRRKSRRSLTTPAQKVVVAVLGTTLFGFIYLHRAHPDFLMLPVWVMMYEDTVMWNAVFALISFSFAFTALRASTEKSVVARLLPGTLAVLLVAIIYTEWATARHIADELTDRVDPDGAILQSSGWSCSPAAAANLMRLYGRTSTERELAALFRTTPSGTMGEWERHGFESLGFVCRSLNVTNRDLGQVVPPAMLGVEVAGRPPIPHSVAFVAWLDGKALICDPMSGYRLLTRYQVHDWWRGGGMEVRLPGVEPVLTNAYHPVAKK
jgi:hypothetical protein